MTTDDLRWLFLAHLDAHARGHLMAPHERRALAALREVLSEDEELLGRVQARYRLDAEWRADRCGRTS
jgi:hypothetical protein